MSTTILGSHLASTPVSLPAPTSRAFWLAPAAVFAIALGVYLRTMMPGVGYWDTAEFQTVPHLLGIMHTTGYPTYTLVGKLFSLLPFGSVAYRMTLFSGLCAASASALLAGLVQRLATWPCARPLALRHRAIALGAGLAFAFNQTLWHTATRADAHTLHVAFALGATYLALRWHQLGRRRTLVALAAVVGLGLGNHMLMAMLVPGLALLVLLGPGREALVPRTLGPTLAAGLAGLSVYAYLPLRAFQHPALDYGKPTTWENLRQLVFASDVGMGGALFGPVAVGRFLVWLGRMPETLGPWFTPLGANLLLALVPVGLGVLARRDWRLAVSLLVLGLPSLYVGVVYPNGDAARYMFILLAIAVGLAALTLMAALDALVSVLEARKPVQLAATVASAAFAVMPLQLVPANWAASDQSRDHSAETLVAEVFQRIPPQTAVVCEWNEATPLWYATLVEHQRPDVEVVYETNATEAVRASLEDGIARRLGSRPVVVLLLDNRYRQVESRFELQPIHQYQPRGLTLARVVRAR